VEEGRHETRPRMAGQDAFPTTRGPALVPDPFSPLSRHDFRETVISRKGTERDGVVGIRCDVLDIDLEYFEFTYVTLGSARRVF